MNVKYRLKKEGKFNYTEIGEGRPIIILHGLMGGLSNFDGVIKDSVELKGQTFKKLFNLILNLRLGAFCNPSTPPYNPPNTVPDK